MSVHVSVSPLTEEMEGRRHRNREENKAKARYEQTCYWWMGRLSELLKEAEEGKKLSSCRNSVGQGVRACRMCGAVSFSTLIQNTVTIVHGPMGCAGAWRTLLNNWFPIMGMSLPILFCTALDENDVIHGGEEKLAEAILKADKVIKPDLIAVLSTCSAGIIGDNVDDVVDSIRGKVKASVISVPCAGFAYNNQSAGIDDLFRALVKDVMEPQKEIIPNSINVFAKRDAESNDFIYETDTTVVNRTLREMGVVINSEFCGNCSLDDIKKSPRAELNVIRCVGSSISAVKEMEKKFGTPWIVPPMPEGLKASTEYFTQIADFFGGSIKKKAQQITKEKENWAWSQVKPLLPFLKGKRAFVFAGSGRTPTLASMAADLGLEVAYLGLLAIRDRTVYNLKWFYETYGQDPEVIVEPNFYEDEALIDRLDPDIWIADFLNVLVGVGKRLPTMEDMVYQPPHFGYEGFVKEANQIYWLLKNSLVRKAGHRIRPPYMAERQFLKKFHPSFHSVSRCCMSQFEEVGR